jgi:hypothetical protein
MRQGTANARDNHGVQVRGAHDCGGDARINKTCPVLVGGLQDRWRHGVAGSVYTQSPNLSCATNWFNIEMTVWTSALVRGSSAVCARLRA